MFDDQMVLGLFFGCQQIFFFGQLSDLGWFTITVYINMYYMHVFYLHYFVFPEAEVPPHDPAFDYFIVETMEDSFWARVADISKLKLYIAN